jgi:hypothetical protein
MQGAEDGLLVLNVWCPCWARFAKSDSAQRGPSGDKKKTRAWNKIDFMERKIEVQKMDSW